MATQTTDTDRGSALELSVTERARRKRGRRTQAERSAEMRARIQAATLECLAEVGYMGTSFATVAERAGVSRGALQHHYRSKSFLIAGALEALTTRVEVDVLDRVAAQSPGPSRAAGVVDGLWRAASTPPMPVVTEVRVAAKADAELREIVQPMEWAARRRQHQVVAEALGETIDEIPDLTLRVDAALATIRGLTVQLFYEGWSREDTEAAWRVALDDFQAGLTRARARSRRG